MRDFGQTPINKTIDPISNKVALRQRYAYIFKVSSTYYCIRHDGQLLSSNSDYVSVLNNACSNCSSDGGGELFHLDGTYSINSTPANIPDNVSLEGEDMNTTILQFGNLAQGVHALKLGVGSRLRNFKIVGDISTLRNIYTGDIIVRSGCVIENIWLSNMSYGFNCQITGTTPYNDSSIKHVRFRNIKCDNIKGNDDFAACIHMFSNATLGAVDDIKIENFYFSNCNRGIECEDGPSNCAAEHGYMEAIKNFNSTGGEAFCIDAHAHDGEVGPENIKYKDIYLYDCQYPTAKHTGTTWLDSEMPKNIAFEDITIDTPNAVQAFSGHGITLKKVKFKSNNIGNHFAVQRNSRNFVMENCESDTLHTSHLFFAISHSDVIGVKVTKSRIQVSSDKDTSGNKIIQISNGKDITFENNTIENAKSANAIFVSVAATVRNNYISYAASSPATYGVWSQAPDAIIEGNRFGTGPGTAHIVARDGAIRNDISKNVIPDAYIWVRNTASYINVHDNIIAPSITGILIEATADHLNLARNINFVTDNGGTFTQSGDGTTTAFTIAHGLSVTPTVYPVIPGSADAMGEYYLTVDSTNITITYAIAPPSGSSNLVFRWSAVYR